MRFENEVPQEFWNEASQKGTVERFTYESNTYDDEGRTLHKGAWVYVPYGYDSSKKYDILYLMHGGSFTEEWWFKLFPETVNIVDNLIEKGLCEPLLIVTPTFYRDDQDKTEIHEGRSEDFRFELRRDLIPSVEKKYSTYAGGDVSEESLIASRNHRGFAGLSLGSMTTYRSALYNNFDLFSWLGPYSGCTGPFGDRDNEVRRISKALEEGEKNGYKLDLMYCCNGDEDIAYEEHVEIMEKAEKACPILRRGVNYEFNTIPHGTHDMKFWQIDLYNTLQVFFR